MSIKKYFSILILSCLLLVIGSNFVFAAGLVPCNPHLETDPNTNQPVLVNKCTLCDFLQLGKNLINYMIQISILLSVVFMIWGGFVIITAGGSPENVTKGRTVITTAVIGVAIALGAWLIIGTVLNIVTNSPSALPWTQIQCK